MRGIMQKARRIDHQRRRGWREAGTFDVGDELTITAPSPADATQADVFVTLRARFT